MVNVRQTIKTTAERRGITKYGAVISSCVMLVLAVIMFALALFAPYIYYSDRDVLHVLHIDDDVYEHKVDVYVSQNIAVHQSMFRVFSAAEALGDASVLHAFYTNGEMPDDPDRLDKARRHLKELRDEYDEIYSATAREAMGNGIAVGSHRFAEALAKNLSRMNFMALDLLEAAVTADKPQSYDAMYSACLMSMFCGIFNILIMALSVVVLVFAILNLATKRKAVETPILFRLYVIFSAVCLLMCLFNTAIAPASGPLAMCCTAVSVCFIYGAVRSVLSDGSGTALIRNMTVAAFSGIGMLTLAATPSYIMYLNGLGGHYLYYRGTVGTVYFSWIEAMSTVGLEISHEAITIARALGIIVCFGAVVCADKALARLYHNTERKSVLSSVAMFVTCAVSISLCIGAAVCTAGYKNDGELVEYIAGASWYVSAALMLVGGLFGLLFKVRSGDAQSEDAPAEVTDTAESSENAENATADAESADNSENSETV